MNKIKVERANNNSAWVKITSLTKLLLRTYFVSFQNYFFSFVFPILILVIAGEITRVSSISSSGVTNYVAWGTELLRYIPGIMGLGIVSFCIISSTVRIVSLKESVFIKRIAITPIKRKDFIIINMVIIFVLSFISAMWVWGWAELFYHRALGDALNHLKAKSNGITQQTYYGFLYFFLGIFLIIFACSGIGLLVSSQARNVQAAFGIVSLIFFPNMFFSGIIVPPNLINDTSDALRWVSYFMPVKYPLQVMLEGFFGQNIFDPNMANILTLGTYGANSNLSTFTSVNVPDWFAFAISVVIGGGGITGAALLWKWE